LGADAVIVPLLIAFDRETGAYRASSAFESERGYMVMARKDGVMTLPVPTDDKPAIFFQPIDPGDYYARRHRHALHAGADNYPKRGKRVRH